MVEIEQKAHAIAGQPFNLNSTRQLCDLLFDKLKLPVVKRTASGAPCSGIRPVQLGTAVKRNPATVASAKPKIISCPCQSSGAIAIGSTASPRSSSSQNGTANVAHSAESRKNGRNPADRIAGARVAR